MRAFDIVTVGCVFKENIQFPTHTIGPLLGATVSYSSITLGRLGARVGMVSNVGNDMPDSLLRPIVDSRVDMKGLHVRQDAPTTTTLLVYSQNGTKEVKYLKKAPAITFTDIPDDYLKTKAVFFCAVDFDVSPETVGEVHSKGITTAADMGGFGGAHVSEQSMTNFVRKRKIMLDAYGRYIDIAKVSLEDCVYLFGMEDIEEHEALKRLLATGIDTAVLTLGQRGSIIANTGGEIIEVPAIPAKALDTTGAGDTFMAAFLYRYLQTEDLYTAGLFASAAASLLIEKTGGATLERIPAIEEVRERLKVFGGDSHS